MGVTAYAGLIDAAELRDGDVVWVSAAAGAVGGLAAQIAKLRGHRVIGSAGSEAKVRFLLDELGLDAAFNYHDGPVVDLLREAAPDGIDVYFDNVGGDHLEAALATLRNWGRAALCGAISECGSVGPARGPGNLFQATANNLTLRGFRGSAYQHRLPDVVRELGGWLAEGRLRYPETVIDGLERAPEAFMRVLSGDTTGKALVRIAVSRDHAALRAAPGSCAGWAGSEGASLQPATARQRSTKTTVSSSERFPPGRYQCQTLLYKPSSACVSSRGSASRDRSLLHPPGQERCPGEFDIAHPGAGEPARLFLARRLAWDGDQPLFGDQDPVAEDLVLGEIGSPVEHARERWGEITPVRRKSLEPLLLGLECLGVDLEQAVELGLEVVVQRGGAEADVRGDVRPLRVLVAVAAEVIDRCRQDLLALASRTRRTYFPLTRPGLHILGHCFAFSFY